MIIKKVYSYISSHIVEIARKKYRQRNKKRLLNNRVSIIANDCIGGVIYHDLGLEFLSPTINLFFDTADDYIEYLRNIRYYSTATPKQIKTDNVKYPVAEIKRGNKHIVIHFMHYDTFDKARDKWLERGKRINYDNIMIIMHYGNINGPDISLFKMYKSLPYKNKLMITGKKCKIKDSIIYKSKVYSKNYFPGKILLYKSPYSIKKYIDDIGYVKLINQCVE